MRTWLPYQISSQRHRSVFRKNRGAGRRAAGHSAAGARGKNKFQFSTPTPCPPVFGSELTRNVFGWMGHRCNAATLRGIHKFLWQLTVPETHGSADANATEMNGVDFFTRALVLQALRRAVLRDSVLLRLSPQNGDLHESGWGESARVRGSLTISPINTKAWPSALSCFWKI